MDELLKALNDAESLYSSICSDVSEAQNVMGIQKEETKKKPLKPTFSKASRFQANNKSNLDATMSSIDSIQSENSWNKSKEKISGPCFFTSKRFIDKKPEQQPMLHPKLDLTKPRAPKACITKPKDSKEVQESFLSEANTTISSSVGPGAYNVKYSAVEVPATKVIISKSTRFKHEKQNDSSIFDLNPSIAPIKKRVPTAKMYKPTEKTNHIKEMQKEIQEQLKLQAEFERRLDETKMKLKLQKSKTKKKKSTIPSKKERLIQMFKLMDALCERRRGPGAYVVKTPFSNIPCLVKYKSDSHSPLRAKLETRTPGPATFDPIYDLVKTRAPGVRFAKSQRAEKPKLDGKRPLNIKYKLVKSRSVGAIILPEHAPPQQPDFSTFKMGPGKYEPSYKLVEKRDDIGIGAFQPITESNDRQNAIHKKLDPDEAQSNLEPKLTLVKKHAPEIIISKPTERVLPPGIPDAEIFREHWKFYDKDLDVIKERPYEVDFAGGIKFEDFKLKQEEFETLKDYIRRRAKKPDIGQYDIRYDQIDKNMDVVDFGKLIPREIPEETGIDKNDKEIEGDVLILEPHQPKMHLAEINFTKMVGREEEIKLPDDSFDELDLKPNYDVGKKKIINLVNMAKMLERDGGFQNKDNDPDDDVLDLRPDFKHVEPKIKVLANFEKEVGRVHKEPDPDRDEGIIDLNYDAVKPNNKRGVKIMPPVGKPIEPPNMNDQAPNQTEERIDMDKLIKATRPETPIVDFNRYSKRN